MPVIERHRNWLQRLTGTGYPAGHKPKLLAATGGARASTTHTTTARAFNATRAQTIATRTKKPDTRANSNVGFYLLIGLVVFGTALVSLLVMSPSSGKPTITLPSAKGMRETFTVIAGIAIFGLVMYVRYHMSRLTRQALGVLWSGAKSAINTVPTTAAAPPKPGTKKPAGLGLTLGMFLLVNAFLSPIWLLLLSAMDLHKIAILGVVPYAAFAWWAFRRHGRSLQSS